MPRPKTGISTRGPATTKAQYRNNVESFNTDQEDWLISLSEANVRRVFNQVNTRKATGPDGIPGRVLRECAEQLTGIFTVIFNLSLSQSVIPICFKMTTIIPVPKNSKAKCHNDYCPVALTCSH
jgi:hypothetical protein